MASGFFKFFYVIGIIDFIVLTFPFAFDLFPSSVGKYLIAGSEVLNQT